MKKNRFFIFLCSLFFVCAVHAQILKPVPITFLNENATNRKFVSVPSLVAEKTAPKSVYKSFSVANNFKCTLPKGAIFCRMEDAIFNHLNFWVKFRMGTDDRYSN